MKGRLCTTVRWRDNETNALKKAMAVFYGNNKAKMIMYPSLAAMQTGRLLAPKVEIILELFCNKPEFFLFGTKTSDTGVKNQVTLGRDDIKMTCHLCHLNLNSSVYNDVRNQWTNYPVV